MRIQNINLTEEHKGRLVTYTTTGESGKISSWNDIYVFVKYFGENGLQPNSKATKPEDLTWVN